MHLSVSFRICGPWLPRTWMKRSTKYLICRSCQDSHNGWHRPLGMRTHRRMQTECLWDSYTGTRALQSWLKCGGEITSFVLLLICYSAFRVLFLFFTSKDVALLWHFECDSWYGIFFLNSELTPWYMASQYFYVACCYLYHINAVA